MRDNWPCKRLMARPFRSLGRSSESLSSSVGSQFESGQARGPDSLAIDIVTKYGPSTGNRRGSHGFGCSEDARVALATCLLYAVLHQVAVVCKPSFASNLVLADLLIACTFRHGSWGQALAEVPTAPVSPSALAEHLPWEELKRLKVNKFASCEVTFLRIGDPKGDWVPL